MLPLANARPDLDGTMSTTVASVKSRRVRSGVDGIVLGTPENEARLNRSPLPLSDVNVHTQFGKIRQP